jgi:HAD superfamily hydrolase (TIGR01490 family)
VRLVFFDFDRTLISRNSATLWIRHELAARRIGMAEAARYTMWLLRYSLGARDMTVAIRRTVANMAGRADAELRQRIQAFYESHLKALYRPGARAAIAAHRCSGDRLVLLTSAANHLAERVCRDMGLDDHVSTRFEVDDRGLYTGRPIEPLCFGPGKVVLATRYAAARGLSLADSTFYTDSLSDLPMLEAAGDPAVVHPDPRLRRLARQRGWRMLDWGEP